MLFLQVILSIILTLFHLILVHNILLYFIFLLNISPLKAMSIKKKVPGLDQCELSISLSGGSSLSTLKFNLAPTLIYAITHTHVITYY